MKATRIILLTLLFLLRSQAQNESNTSCHQTTVDEFAPEIAAQAKSFLCKLKSAIQENDRELLASMVTYPLPVHEGKGTRTIQNRREFVYRYRDVITPEVKAAVVGQSPECLFANYEGVMIGRGQVWFEAESSRAPFKIITINLTAASGQRQHPPQTSK